MFHRRRHFVCSFVFCVAFSVSIPALVYAEKVPGELPALSDLQVSQEDIASGRFYPHALRCIGGLVFSTSFNKLDGYGHGPFSTHEPDFLETRPTLQGNGTFLRVNGLDAQSCLECHSVLSNAVVPFRFGVGGVGASSSNVMFKPTLIDPATDGKENYNGRFINPPFIFGPGCIELLANEMTIDLQQSKAQAQQNPGTPVALVTKGVSFGSLSYQSNGECDTSQIEGIDADLVVRPFGRKGEFSTVRAFDVGAMEFHFGMEPVELVGVGVDRDGDGVTNEVSIGQMSALHIFSTFLTPPFMENLSGEAQYGKYLFEYAGCADCHMPALTTERPILTYSFPEVPTDPTVNIFHAVDLTAYPTFFEKVTNGGLLVPLFADLKRRDMGPGLAESFGRELAAQFTTARFWGVADTAPYLHDGRALTLTDSISMHGGGPQKARDTFASFYAREKRHSWHFSVHSERLMQTISRPISNPRKTESS